MREGTKVGILSSAEVDFRHQGEEKMEGKGGRRRNGRWQKRNGKKIHTAKSFQCWCPQWPWLIMRFLSTEQSKEQNNSVLTNVCVVMYSDTYQRFHCTPLS